MPIDGIEESGGGRYRGVCYLCGHKEPVASRDKSNATWWLNRHREQFHRVRV
jgi:hypothetical protein